MSYISYMSASMSVAVVLFPVPVLSVADTLEDCLLTLSCGVSVFSSLRRLLIEGLLISFEDLNPPLVIM